MPNRTDTALRASLPLFLGLALAGASIAQTPKPVMNADNLTVSVSGENVSFTGGKPKMQGESVLVPFRAVLEKLGSKVSYDAATKRIDAATTSHSVQLTTGSTAAKVDDRDITMGVAPQNIGGTVYIPLRFVSESLKATVDYDAAAKTVAITPGKEETTTPPDVNATNTDPSNAMVMPANDANMATNTDAQNAANDANNAANAANQAANDANNAANNMANNAANTPPPVANTTPPPTTPPVATTAPAPVVETAEPSNIPWPIILGLLALAALGALAYFFFKNNRAGQVIASNNDTNNKPK